MSRNGCAVHDLTIFDEMSPYDLGQIFLRIAKKFAFQLEECPKTGKQHYQCRISLKVKKRINELVTILDNEKLQKFHISPTSKDCSREFFYVMKDDSRVDGPWTEDDITRIPKDVVALRKLYPWQQEMMDMLSVYDERRIDIIYDPRGNHGKSTFVRFMATVKGAANIPMARDYRDIMRTAYCLNHKKERKIFLIDMPRAMNKTKLCEFFAGVETLKSGYVFDDRHVFKEEYIDRPRICIFTNELPELGLLSRDMWHIWSIDSHDLSLNSICLDDYLNSDGGSSCDFDDLSNESGETEQVPDVPPRINNVPK